MDLSNVEVEADSSRAAAAAASPSSELSKVVASLNALNAQFQKFKPREGVSRGSRGPKSRLPREVFLYRLGKQACFNCGSTEHMRSECKNAFNDKMKPQSN